MAATVIIGIWRGAAAYGGSSGSKPKSNMRQAAAKNIVNNGVAAATAQSAAR